MKKFINFVAMVTIALIPVSITFGADVGSRINTATIMPNYLSSDGCEHTVVIRGQEYALDYASYTAIENAFLKRIDNVGMLRQTLTYNVTGKTGIVNCGRGANKVLPEIRVMTYIPKYTIASVSRLLPNRYGIDTFGCQHTVSIGSANYALDSASYAKVANLFDNAYNPDLTIYKRIGYRLTGRDGTLICGGGNNTNLEEISINTIY